MYLCNLIFTEIGQFKKDRVGNWKDRTKLAKDRDVKDVELQV
jgi:hypothetical protein